MISLQENVNVTQKEAGRATKDARRKDFEFNAGEIGFPRVEHARSRKVRVCLLVLCRSLSGFSV